MIERPPGGRPPQQGYNRPTDFRSPRKKRTFKNFQKKSTSWLPTWRVTSTIGVSWKASDPISLRGTCIQSVSDGQRVNKLASKCSRCPRRHQLQPSPRNTAQALPYHLAGDGDQGHRVEQGIGQASHQVGRACEEHPAKHAAQQAGAACSGGFFSREQRTRAQQPHGGMHRHQCQQPAAATLRAAAVAQPAQQNHSSHSPGPEVAMHTPTRPVTLA